jgi:DNA-binding transcriptional MerR regulator
MLTLGMKTNEMLHPIGYVSRRTGLTTHVIRVWEHRYKAIEPIRTDTNRRQYTDADIERLSLLKAATAAGHSISSVASIPDDQLRSIVREDEMVGRTQAPDLLDPISESQDFLLRCQSAVPDMNRNLLETTLSEASATLEGWRVIYLGANTPLHEISIVVKEQNARAVGLSATYMEDPGRLVAELSHLRQMLPDSCPIFVGGSAAGQSSDALEQIGVRYVQDLQSFRVGLRDTLETYSLT